jgi:hypothetical protein
MKVFAPATPISPSSPTKFQAGILRGSEVEDTDVFVFLPLSPIPDRKL